MEYEKSPIKDLKDLKPHPDYTPRKVPDEGKTEYTGDTNWNAVNRGFPAHKGGMEHEMPAMHKKIGK